MPAKNTDPDDDTQPEEITLESLMAVIVKQDETIASLADDVRDSRAQANLLPLTQTTGEMLNAAGIDHMKPGEARSGHRVMDPTGRRPAFRTNDIVVLNEENAAISEKVALWRKAGRAKEEPIYGVVHSLAMTRKRDGIRKYRVDVPGITDESFYEDELTMVKAS